MTLLIPGPKSSGKDIDVYLRPLIDDLKVLWAKLGVETIDVATGLKFNMRAMVLWTINDFPARNVMHIEKNVLESILNTLLMNEKSKDTTKARQDLERLGIRSGLWLGQNKNRKCSKPHAAYSFTPEDRKKFPELHFITPATSSTTLVSKLVSQQPCIPPNRDDWDRLFQLMFDEYFNPLTIAVSPVQEAVDPRAEVLADSPVSISINQDDLSTSIHSSQEQEHSPIISQGFKESPKTSTFHDDPLNESPQEPTSQGSSSNVIQIHTPFKHLGRWTKDHPIANVIDDPSRFVSTRKQLETDAMWCYFDAFLTSELVPCLDNVFLIKLKWIYKIKIDESGGVLNNKARLVAQGFRQEEGIDFEESFAPVANQMINKFKMSMMGQISFFLGLQISQSPRGIFINQSKYASEIIKKYGLTSTDSVDTPMIENKKLDEDLQGKPVDATLYCGMIGS
nr:hypothetical protein [Tanacetum cinerariifolium]